MEEKEFGVPQLRPMSAGILREALARGWADFRARPGFGLFLVLPLLGHASWHVYRLISQPEGAA